MMLGELALASVEKGDIIQLHKRGFFICDEPYKQMRYVDLNILKEEDVILTFLFPSSEYGYPESPITLFYIPGGSKATS